MALLEKLRSRLRGRVRELDKQGRVDKSKIHVKSLTVNKKVTGVWITKDVEKAKDMGRGVVEV